MFTITALADCIRSHRDRPGGVSALSPIMQGTRGLQMVAQLPICKGNVFQVLPGDTPADVCYCTYRRGPGSPITAMLPEHQAAQDTGEAPTFENDKRVVHKCPAKPAVPAQATIFHLKLPFWHSAGCGWGTEGAAAVWPCNTMYCQERITCCLHMHCVAPPHSCKNSGTMGIPICTVLCTWPCWHMHHLESRTTA